ncbi:MAG: 2OG-Fe(II) oxygenase [Glaciimonas sp.]|nr:2OG-Fe(II) oxygenase [Glaciimonas sp.]
MKIMLPDNALLLRIADDLVEHGWSQQDAFLPQELTLQLAGECRARAAQGALTPAGIGRGAAMAVQEGVRGDRIQWLEPGQSPACERYLQIMETVRLALNRTLYLGLEDYECHFALYPPGAFYQKHLDRFHDDDCRTVSVIVYLNDAWLPEHGGALRLYPGGKNGQDVPDARDVAPLANRLALFLSADMPHEVLPSTRERLSLTGWFRRRHWNGF